MALSERFLVTASQALYVAWMPRSAAATSAETVPASIVADVDVSDDRLVWLGARRNKEGEFAPDGAIAWLGSLAESLADLKPVFFSSRGARVPDMNHCALLDPGAVRFLPDGSFLLVPGIEPGIFLYAASGELRQVWDGEAVRIYGHCDVTDEQRRKIFRSAAARASWVNLRRVLDEILILPDGPALVVRQHRGGRPFWELVKLHPGGAFTLQELPIESAAANVRLRGDVRGRRAVLLLHDPYDWSEKPAFTPRLVLLDLPR